MYEARPVVPIPVLRPRLPTAEALLPWLRRIDESRIYGNFGPLSVEFAHRLGRHFGVGGGGVLPLANGTLGLSACLTALGVEHGTLCAMPAFSFVATAHAAIAAGLVPWLLDIEEDNWQLSPANFERALAKAPGAVGAVVPVCPFGQPVDWAGWAEVRRRTGIEVVIDAAAAFDALRPGPLPAVVSLHATKAFGVGEGGLVVAEDRDLITEVRRRINFGFMGSRVAETAATNGKMSEYHAAVGLAALEGWPAARAEFSRVQRGLRQGFEEAGIICPAQLGDEWVSSTFCLRLPVDADAVAVAVAASGIETRRWWNDGLHRHPAFAACPRPALPVTDLLAKRVLGFPCSVDLNEDAISAIVARTLAACAKLGRE